MPGIVSVIFGILLFSILIFVHELGHFMAAKAFGVQVNEFSMFMGPAIFKKQRGETLYTIRCIPIGGFCAMEGEDQDTDNPRSFQKAAWWKRLIILVAGAAMNFIIGIVFFALIYIPVKEIGSPVITEFSECCIFDGENGLQIGDEIYSIDGERVYTVSNIGMLFDLNPGGVHDIVVIRNGEKKAFPALQMSHTHELEDGTKKIHYGLGWTGSQDATFGRKVKAVWYTTLDNARMVRLSLQMLFSGKVGLSEMAGPVGIVDMMSEAATTAPSFLDALLNLVYFGGFLAVNLGIMNLLPFPALDGGRVLALVLTTAVETVTKKKINPKYEGYIHAVGMILLLLLMVFILFKDVFMIFKG